MSTLLSFLSTFGITPGRYPFLFLAILLIAGVIYIRVSLGRPLRKIKENILIIVTHLATSRSKLNPTLIKEMSPLEIQPDGQRILKESGFLELFENPLNKAQFFAIINAKNPTTKLEVESYSIYSFLDVMTGEGVFNSVKAYLYQHPDIRDTFPTLAGVYIRDKYLELHPEITQ